MIFTASVDWFWTKAPNCAATPGVASVIVTAEIVGALDEGTFSVTDVVAVPTVVLPCFVVPRIVSRPLAALGMLAARFGVVQV